MANLHTLTVQEATNQTAQRKSIRVTPTVVAGETADNDVMFNATEIPNAVLGKGSCSKLIGITIINKDDEQHDFDIILMQVQTNFGTADAVSDITDANLQASKVIGVLPITWVDGQIVFAQDSGSASIYTASSQLRGAQSTSTSALPLLLQAEDDSTSVYFTAIANGAAIDFAAVDDLEFVFHVEY